MALVSDEDIQLLFDIYFRDREALRKFDRYHQGHQDPPFIPRTANAEYKLIASRCFTNFMRQAVAIPVQTLYVDGFRKSAGDSAPVVMAQGPEWKTWQRSRMDSIQSAIYSGAFVFGFSLVDASRDPKTGKSRLRGISALRSSAVFDDPANDIVPRAAIEFLSDPKTRERVGSPSETIPGTARVWGDTHEEIISWTNTNGKRSFTRISARRHGATSCPVTRFAASMDLEGRCIGIVEPLIQLQDRLNQSVHDLLIAQVYTSNQVRTATGMARAVKQEPVFEKDLNGNIIFGPDGHPSILTTRDVLDASGMPVLEEANIDAATMLVSENPDAKFGVLPGAPLDGFIKSIELSIKNFATLSATPPHYMMGSITNISADALQAAEIALKRKIDLFKVTFGECWERVINVSCEIDGEMMTPDDLLETMWRDMEGQSFARMADALLKLKELNIPAQGLWSMLPGITATELKQWHDLVEEDPEQVLASAVAKGQQSAAPDGPQSSPNGPTQANADEDLE